MNRFTYIDTDTDTRDRTQRTADEGCITQQIGRVLVLEAPVILLATNPVSSRQMPNARSAMCTATARSYRSMEANHVDRAHVSVGAHESRTIAAVRRHEPPRIGLLDGKVVKEQDRHRDRAPGRDGDGRVVLHYLRVCGSESQQLRASSRALEVKRPHVAHSPANVVGSCLDELVAGATHPPAKEIARHLDTRHAAFEAIRASLDRCRRAFLDTLRFRGSTRDQGV